MSVASPAVSTWARVRRDVTQEQIVLLVGLALAVGFAIMIPGFLSLRNFLTIARSVSPLGVLALAAGLVVIARGLDLSLVAVMSVATSLTLYFMEGTGTAASIAIGVGITLGVGALNGFLIAFVEMPPLFTTLASGLFVYGVARVLWLDTLVQDLTGEADVIRFLGEGRIAGIPVPMIIFAVVAIAIHFLLKHTTLGRFIYAHGDNQEAAALTGLPVRPLTMIEYSLGAGVGYLAGLMIAGTAGNFNIQIVTSSPLIFEVLAVVVIGGISLVGGRGGVSSVLAGALLIGVLLNGMILLDLNRNIQTIVEGLILLAAILLDRKLHPRDEETVRQGD